MLGHLELLVMGILRANGTNCFIPVDHVLDACSLEPIVELILAQTSRITDSVNAYSYTQRLPLISRTATWPLVQLCHIPIGLVPLARLVIGGLKVACPAVRLRYIPALPLHGLGMRCGLGNTPFEKIIA